MINTNIFFKFRDRFKLAVRFKKAIEIAMAVLVNAVFAISISLEDIKPFNYVSIILFGLFCFLLLFYLLAFGELIFDVYVIAMLIFLASQYISSMFNFFPYYTKTPTLMCLMSIFVYTFAKQKNIDAKKCLRYLFISASFLIFVFSIKYYKDILKPNFSNRIGTYFGNQNDVARHLSFSCIIFIYSAFVSKNKILKPLFYFLSFYSFYCILLTGSVSNAGITLLIFIFHLYFYFNKSKKMKIIFICSLVGTIALLIVAINLPTFSYFKHRILSMINSFLGSNNSLNSRDTSAEGRLEAALYGFELFLESPIFGNGYRSVFRNFCIMSHNNISEVASDFGIVGLLVEEFIILFPIIRNKKRRMEIYLPMLFIALFQFFLVSYNSKIESIVIPLCYAMLSNEDVKLRHRVILFKEVSV